MNAPRHVGRALPEMKYGTRTIAAAAPAASALPVATVVGVALPPPPSDTAAAGAAVWRAVAAARPATRQRHAVRRHVGGERQK